MSLIDRLSGRLQRHPKRVVFPEGAEPRVLQAARQFASRRLGVPMLVGDRAEIRAKAAALDVKLDDIRIIEPERSDDFEEFEKRFEGLRRFGGAGDMDASVTLRHPHWFAAMMLATGRADALVSGATTLTSSGLRAILRIVPRREGAATVSSLQIMELADQRFGTEGVLFMTDCGVLADPTAEQLAENALTTARIAWHLTNSMPRIAFLSHLNKVTETHSRAVGKMKIAAGLCRARAHQECFEIEVDGELQVDVALSTSVAALKGMADSPVAGRSNVLVFPNLDCAHIASKMVEVLAGTPTYGQILTGLRHPCAELSRGATAHDIFGTAVLVASQAVDARLLHGTGV